VGTNDFERIEAHVSVQINPSLVIHKTWRQEVASNKKWRIQNFQMGGVLSHLFPIKPNTLIFAHALFVSLRLRTFLCQLQGGLTPPPSPPGNASACKIVLLHFMKRATVFLRCSQVWKANREEFGFSTQPNENIDLLQHILILSELKQIIYFLIFCALQQSE